MEKSKKENQDVHSEDKDLFFEKLFERIETRLDEIEGKLMKHIDEKYAEIESKNAKNFSIEEIEKKLKKIKVPISDTEKTREKQKTYGLKRLS